jgi:hypothetical protein
MHIDSAKKTCVKKIVILLFAVLSIPLVLSSGIMCSK